MPTNACIERVVKKALKDSSAPASTSPYDPPDEPELREIYDEIYSRHKTPPNSARRERADRERRR